MSTRFATLPFSEQLEYFRRKLNLPTQGWTDVYAAEHDWAFMVAGASRDEIVADFRQAIERAIEEGRTLAQFRKDFDAIVAKHGWEYNGGRNWRSRVIYETNLRTSYAAGRWAQLQAVKEARPYWLYVHSDAVQEPRPLHQAWGDMQLVLHADDPWWHTHFPPNGWGCQCTVHALNERDLRRMGKDGPDQAPVVEYETRTIGQRSPNGPRDVRVPVGIDPGFEYAPGRSRIDSATPPPRPGPLAPGVPSRPPPDPMPPARPAPAPLGDGPDGFLQRLGASRTESRLWVDPVGERVPIGPALFPDALELPVDPALLPWVAEALAEPDEIWTRIEWLGWLGVAEVRRRYLARLRQPAGGTQLVVFERGRSGWSGAVVPDESADAWRAGVRLYRRGDGP